MILTMRSCTIVIALCAAVTVAVVNGAENTKDKLKEDSQDECCYPRPPQVGRALKQQLRKCCEFPVSQIWEDFEKDVEECKERRKKEEAAEVSTTTTTPAPVEDNEFDADMPDESNETEDQEDEMSATVTQQPNAPLKKARGHHGRGRGRGKFRGRGVCIREAMEKRNWAAEGKVNYENILKSTETAFNESAKDWVPVVREAISNCSKHAPPESNEKQARYYGCPKQMTPEKQAWRCIVNNSILKCPQFPQDNEYCQQLRTAHDKCQAMSLEGPMQFRWCGTPRGRKHNKRPRPVQ